LQFCIQSPPIEICFAQMCILKNSPLYVTQRRKALITVNSLSTVVSYDLYSYQVLPHGDRLYRIATFKVQYIIQHRKRSFARNIHPRLVGQHSLVHPAIFKMFLSTTQIRKLHRLATQTVPVSSQHTCSSRLVARP